MTEPIPVSEAFLEYADSYLAWLRNERAKATEQIVRWQTLKLRTIIFSVHPNAVEAVLKVEWTEDEIYRGTIVQLHDTTNYFTAPSSRLSDSEALASVLDDLVHDLNAYGYGPGLHTLNLLTLGQPGSPPSQEES